MSDLGLFVGRFHPLLVHFPIALIVAAALLQAIAAWRERATPDTPSPLRAAVALLAGLGALGAIAAAAAGWLLGSSGGYSGDLVDRHQLLGFSVAAAATFAALATLLRSGSRSAARVQAIGLTVTVLLLVPTGHLGATLTHGEGYLTEHAPEFVRSWFEAASPAPPAAMPPDRVKVYATLVQPVLQRHCVDCHGPAKAQGGLRLDTIDGLHEGGEHGPIVVAGRAASSEIVRRLWLPPAHPDAMPPRPRPPVAPVDASIVRWWIDQGASPDLTLADAEIAPDLRAGIEAVVGPLASGGPTLPVPDVAPADPAALAAVRARGFSIEPIADGLHFIAVHATNAGARIGDGDVETLIGLAPQILWLDLSGTSTGDAALPAIAKLPHLTRLHLARTKVSDAGLTALTPLSHLEYLNLYGTTVSDAGVGNVAALPRLRTLYVWQTGVTPAGATRLASAHPKLVVETGLAGDRAAAPAPTSGATTPAPTR